MRLGRSATVSALLRQLHFCPVAVERRGEEQGKGCPYLPPSDLMFLSGFVNPGTAALIREFCVARARPTHPWLGVRNVLDSADSVLK